MIVGTASWARTPGHPGLPDLAWHILIAIAIAVTTMVGIHMATNPATKMTTTALATNTGGIHSFQRIPGKLGRTHLEFHANGGCYWLS